MHKLPESVQAVINQLRKNGFEAYTVGGSVRDLLLDRPTKSWDFTTNAQPIEIIQLFPESFYDNEFGTVGIKIKSTNNAPTTKLNQKLSDIEDIYEITTYRKELGYSDHRHPDKVIWGETLEEDLARRDFTINAIAFDGGKIIDPYNGQADLKNKLIRSVGDPLHRFTEDGLRLLRAVRIAAELGFMIEENTFLKIQQSAHMIRMISADRVRNEVLKIIGSPHPADGILLLKNAGLMTMIIPELEKCFGVPQKSPRRHHIFDVGTHLIESLRACPSHNPIVRLATLLHDIGKPLVFRKDKGTGLITFYNHEMVGSALVTNIAIRLNFSRKDKEKLVSLVRWHQFTVDEVQTDNTLRRFIKRVGIENLQDILALRIGDRLGGGAQETSWRLRLFMKRLEEVQKQPFTVSDLKVNGHDVMKIFNIGPGPRVGKILDELFNEVITNKIKNEHDLLLKRLKQIRDLV